MISYLRNTLFNPCVHQFILHHKELSVTKRYVSKCIPYFCKIDQIFNGEVLDPDEMVKKICKGDEDLEKKLRILMLEVEVMRQDGRYAPDQIQAKEWEHLLDLPSKSQRSNYLKFLFKNEKSRENQKAKREAKKKEYETTSSEETKEYPDDLLYGISHQSLFLRIRDKSMNNFDNYRALQAIIFGQKIVIDCSYENSMVWRETVNASKQVTLLFADNRTHKEPFDIHLCNVRPEGDFMKHLESNIPTLLEPWFPMNIHTKSYLDLFPKNDLVYLTPYCREELIEFDHNAVYIIGCMVDKSNNEKLSLARAKRDGLKMAKLPLDRYLEWGAGAKKNLNINHMLSILLDLKVHGNWDYALRHVPRRKLLQTKINKMQSKHNFSIVTNEISFSGKPKVILKPFIEKRQNTRRTLYDDDKI